MSEKLDLLIESVESYGAALREMSDRTKSIPDMRTAIGLLSGILSRMEVALKELDDKVGHIMTHGCTMRCPPPDGDATPQDIPPHILREVRGQAR